MDRFRGSRGDHRGIGQPNLFVKVPATAEGIPAVAALVGRGLSININVTLIFALSRYEQVIDAYLQGLETLTARGGEVAAVRSVASIFVSRVDTEVDHRLEEIGGEDAPRVAGTCRSRPSAASHTDGRVVLVGDEDERPIATRGGLLRSSFAAMSPAASSFHSDKESGR